MANKDILDELFKNSKNKFNGLKNVQKTPNNKMWGPLGLGIGAGLSLQGAIEARKYLKSLGEYGAVADQNKDARQIIKDFNSLYFKNNNGNGIGNKGIETIMRLNGLYDVPAKKSQLNQVAQPTAPTQQQLDQAAKTVTGQVLPKDTGPEFKSLPALPVNAINWDESKYASPGANGLPVGGGELPDFLPVEKPDGVISKTQPKQEPSQDKTEANQGLSIDDIIALAQQQSQISNEFNKPVSDYLQSYIENYDKNNKASFWRTLGLAGVSKLLGEKTPMEAARYADYNKNNAELFNIVNSLSKVREQQNFNPLPIYGNIAIAKAMGLSPITAMANPDLIKIYSTMYGQNLGYTEAMNKLRAEQEIANMLERGRSDRASNENILKQNELELKRWQHQNPINTLPAQAQLIGSLINAASFNPTMRDVISTPAFMEYAMRLTGYDPGQIANTMTPQQQAKALMAPGNKSGLNIPAPPRAR